MEDIQMKKPIVLVIMDGVGRGDGGPGDAVKQANTPNLDKLMASCPMTNRYRKDAFILRI